MKLIVNDDCRSGNFRLTWQFEDDIGGNLGDGGEVVESALATLTGEERADAIMYLTAQKTDGVDHDTNGFFWISKADATRALRAIKLAAKSDTGGPLPDWAIKALAAGFTAPKNWKP